MNSELEKVPLIPVSAIGRAIGVGPAAVGGAAARLGIEFTRRANGRSEASFEQAQKIVAALQARR